jgi:hypothetical protein
VIYPTTCRWCGEADVYWLKHDVTKRLAPIDVQPVTNGNLSISRELGIYRMYDAGDEAKGLPRHVNHFSTCAAVKKQREERAQRKRQAVSA